MRRMMLVVTVALVMAAMMVATAMPAFAKQQTYSCSPPDGTIHQYISKKAAKEIMRTYPSGHDCFPDG